MNGQRPEVGGTALDTPLRRMLGVDVPILQAGMGMGARSSLVAAVSDAGGLGVIGGTALAPDELAAEIEAVKRRTDKPFGVDLLFPHEFLDRAEAFAEQAGRLLATGQAAGEFGVLVRLLQPGFVEEQVDACLSSGVHVLVSGLGSPAPFVRRAHGAGARVLALAGSLAQARRLADDGVDAVIASGSDAGGHTGRVGSLSLWAACVEALDVPVVAAGGIADGRTLAAALVMGCQGAWVGTRFLATPEAAVHERAKERVVGMTVDDTVVTRIFSGKPMRVVRNDYVTSWTGREHEVLPFPLQFLATEGRAEWGLQRGDVDGGALPAGQGGGLVHAVEPAAEVVWAIAGGALTALDAVVRTAHA